MMYGETSDVSISNDKIKYPMSRSDRIIFFFSINMPLKLFPATDTNVDIESLKSLHKLPQA